MSADYHCGRCSVAFESQAALDQHVRDLHGHACSICGAPFGDARVKTVCDHYTEKHELSRIAQGFRATPPRDERDAADRICYSDDYRRAMQLTGEANMARDRAAFDAHPVEPFDGPRFVEEELRTAFVATEGLGRVYGSLLARGNRPDAERLAFLILKTKRIFDDNVPREPVDNEARLEVIAAVQKVATGVAELALQVGELVAEMKRFI